MRTSAHHRPTVEVRAAFVAQFLRVYGVKPHKFTYSGGWYRLQMQITSGVRKMRETTAILETNRLAAMKDYAPPVIDEFDSVAAFQAAIMGGAQNVWNTITGESMGALVKFMQGRYQRPPTQLMDGKHFVVFGFEGGLFSLLQGFPDAEGMTRLLARAMAMEEVVEGYEAYVVLIV